MYPVYVTQSKKCPMRGGKFPADTSSSELKKIMIQGYLSRRLLLPDRDEEKGPFGSTDMESLFETRVFL